MSKSMPSFTLGAAFARQHWLTLGVNAVAVTVCCIAGYMHAQTRGLISALCGWALAFLLCELNSFIAQVLDRFRLSGRQYMSGLIQLWAVKILLTVTVGALIVIFVPLHIMTFCVALAGCAGIIVIKNVIISARARIL